MQFSFIRHSFCVKIIQFWVQKFVKAFETKKNLSSIPLYEETIQCDQLDCKGVMHFCFVLFRFICLIPLQWRLTHSRIWLRYKTTKGGKRGEEEFELSDCLRYKNVASSTSTRQSQIINCSRLLLGGHLEKKREKIIITISKVINFSSSLFLLQIVIPR